MGADEEPPVFLAGVLQHHARHLPGRSRRAVPRLPPRIEPSSTGCSGTRPTRPTRTSCRGRGARAGRLPARSVAARATRRRSSGSCATPACRTVGAPVAPGDGRAWEAVTGEAVPEPSRSLPGQLRRRHGGHVARARRDPIDRVRPRRPARRPRAGRARRARGGVHGREGAGARWPSNGAMSCNAARHATSRRSRLSRDREGPRSGPVIRARRAPGRGHATRP